MKNTEILGQMWEDLQNMSEAEKKEYDKRLSEKLRLIEEEERREAISNNGDMELLKAMLDDLHRMTPEERAHHSKLLRQRLREMEEEDKRDQKSEDEEEKLRIINAKNEAMNTGTLSKVLDFWSQKSKEEQEEYLRKSNERRMREIEERARMEDISNNGGLELLKAMLDNWQKLSPEQKEHRRKLLAARLHEVEEESCERLEKGEADKERIIQSGCDSLNLENRTPPIDLHNSPDTSSEENLKANAGVSKVPDMKTSRSENWISLLLVGSLYLTAIAVFLFVYFGNTSFRREVNEDIFGIIGIALFIGIPALLVKLLPHFWRDLRNWWVIGDICDWLEFELPYKFRKWKRRF